MGMLIASDQIKSLSAQRLNSLLHDLLSRGHPVFPSRRQYFSAELNQHCLIALQHGLQNPIITPGWIDKRAAFSQLKGEGYSANTNREE